MLAAFFIQSTDNLLRSHFKQKAELAFRSFVTIDFCFHFINETFFWWLGNRDGNCVSVQARWCYGARLTFSEFSEREREIFSALKHMFTSTHTYLLSRAALSLMIRGSPRSIPWAVFVITRSYIKYSFFRSPRSIKKIVSILASFSFDLTLNRDISVAFFSKRCRSVIFA